MTVPAAYMHYSLNKAAGLKQKGQPLANLKLPTHISCKRAHTKGQSIEWCAIAPQSCCRSICGRPRPVAAEAAEPPQHLLQHLLLLLLVLLGLLQENLQQAPACDAAAATAAAVALAC